MAARRMLVIPVRWKGRCNPSLASSLVATAAARAAAAIRVATRAERRLEGKAGIQLVQEMYLTVGKGLLIPLDSL